MKPYYLSLLLLLLLPAGVNAPNIQQTHQTDPSIVITLPKTPVSLLNMTMLSATINGCTQTANINATWIGDGYYVVSPTSFTLITKQRNAVYGNNTDLANPNESNQWYLFQNIPITLQVSFQFCATINTEKLVYADGTYTFILH